MKASLLALALGLVTLAPLAAHADTMAPAPFPATQMAAMHSKLDQAQQLVASINHSYGTQFAIGPKEAMMAMAHMAKANMEMAEAVMEMQEMWTGTPSPSAYPTSQGGQ